MMSCHDPWSKEGRIWHLYPGNDASDKDAFCNDDPGNDTPDNDACGGVAPGNDTLQKILKCIFKMPQNVWLFLT